MKQTMRIWPQAVVPAQSARTTAWGHDLTTGTLTNCNVAFTVGGSTADAADEGATVTITVTSEPGYATKGITIKAYMSTGEMKARTRNEGSPEIIEEIEVTQDATDSNVFTFTMPKAHIVVDATTTKIIQSNWIQAIEDQTYTGSAITPEIEVKDGDTTLTLDVDYTVTYSNNTAAALSTDATAAPTVTITAKGETYSDAAEKASAKFTINKAAATISFAETGTVSKKFSDDTYTNTLANTGDGIVAYESSAEGVATVDATGKVTFVSASTTTITATVTDGANYTYSGMSDYNSTEKTASITYELTVAPSDITATASDVSMTYSPSGSYGITVNVTKPTDGYTIEYGTTQDAYGSTNPNYSSVGTHTTYYNLKSAEEKLC